MKTAQAEEAGAMVRAGEEVWCDDSDAHNDDDDDSVETAEEAYGYIEYTELARGDAV